MARHKTGFQLKNHLSELETLRTRLEQFQKEAAIPEKAIFEINLILEELFTNIVSCGFRDMEEHWVDITLCRRGSDVTICVRDDGVPFNPVAAAVPDTNCAVEERRIGGIGIHLVKRLSDQMNYRRQGGCNIVTLKKTIAQGDRAAKETR